MAVFALFEPPRDSSTEIDADAIDRASVHILVESGLFVSHVPHADKRSNQTSCTLAAAIHPQAACTVLVYPGIYKRVEIGNSVNACYVYTAFMYWA